MLLDVQSDLSIPAKSAQKHTYSGLLGCSLSLILSKIAKQHRGLIVTIVPDTLFASQLERELKFFLEEKGKHWPVLLFPDWETLPYDTFSPHQDIISERLAFLYQLPHMDSGVLIISIETLMHKLCPQEYLLHNTVWLKKGQRFDLDAARKSLEEAGYRCVPQVMEHGDFSVRGSILDLYPMGSQDPIRLDLFDNEIDSIRYFEVESQRSLEKLDEIQLLPAREFPLNSDAIAHFRTRFRDSFEGDPRQCGIYLDISDGNPSPGIEYYLPLFFNKTSHLFEYLPDNSLIVTCEKVEVAAENFWNEVKNRYEQYRHDRLRPILEPKAVFLQPNEVLSEIKAFPRLQLTRESGIDKSDTHFIVEKLPDVHIESRSEKPLTRLADFISTFNGQVLFCVESAGRRELVKELIASICHPKEVEHWPSSSFLQEKYAIIIAPIDEGIILNKNFAIITEAELLNKRVMQRRLRKGRKFSVDLDLEVQSIAELNVGSPVVHVDYGIGRYLGLTRLSLSGQEAEFLALEYAGGDKLYVPVASLNLISRYSGADIENAPLHKLGTDNWQKAKKKAIEQARDVAAELLEVYAKREAKQGFTFPKRDEYYELFSSEFPFEETPDQALAIQQVLQDLESQKPMDRVVCGDVGFGKTEVALRAAFLAAQGGKQVAVLVPTTLLAEQHYQTFSDRFSGFPIKIEVMSRFRNKKTQEIICEGLEAGKIDIVIGTHKLLQDRIRFKSLGLLIIDEEHRFGVRQKETFKALRSEVDILTLTATPIPRTLNMAMSGLRDLSIIATPPAKRLSVKTFVREKNANLILESISRELHRGGQVYYLHNSVDTILNEARTLEELVPFARIAIAHGQMPERELEQVMSDFYHRKFNVLICTTIIETGIDIPTANTIIMDRADKLGLAQLHQLRGRVGRSHHQAYAFCLIPPKTKISPDATKRLEAIAALEELGSGFSLATHDLEIRGAGELLGESQSGNIQSIGFTLYMELLEQAVKTLKSGERLDEAFAFKKGIEIDLQIPTLIPEAYIPDVHTRLVIYKRIASSKNENKLDDLTAEMIDRFGKLPDQTRNLFNITRLKFKLEELGINKLDAGPKGGRIEFVQNPKVDPRKIVQLIQQKPEQFSLEGPSKLKFALDLIDPKNRIEEVQKIVLSLI